MAWFLGWLLRRGRAVALVLACVLAVAGAGVALWREAPAPPPVAEQQQRSDAAARPAPVGPAPVGPASVGQASVGSGRRVHILDGDRTGGGHRPGRGLPGKSEFPAGWSDDRIIAAIEDVANDPAAARRVEADGRTVVTGRRDGVALRVVVERDGRAIVTGYPTNMPRNPGR